MAFALKLMLRSYVANSTGFIRAVTEVEAVLSQPDSTCNGRCPVVSAGQTAVSL